MLRATLYFAAETQVVAIGLLGLDKMTLLHQECSERMTWRMHPSPGFCVSQIVIATHGLAQVDKGLLVIALVILELAFEHGFANRQDVQGEVAEEAARR